MEKIRVLATELHFPEGPTFDEWVVSGAQSKKKRVFFADTPTVVPGGYIRVADQAGRWRNTAIFGFATQFRTLSGG